VAHQHIGIATKLEDGRHFTIENGAGLCPLLPLDVNTLIVQFHILQSGNGILSETADNGVRTGNGHRQAAFVLFKYARQLTITRVLGHHGNILPLILGRLTRRSFSFLLAISSLLCNDLTLAFLFSSTTFGSGNLLLNQLVDLCIQAL